MTCVPTTDQDPVALSREEKAEIDSFVTKRKAQAKQVKWLVSSKDWIEYRIHCDIAAEAPAFTERQFRYWRDEFPTHLSNRFAEEHLETTIRVKLLIEANSWKTASNLKRIRQIKKEENEA